MSKPTADKVFNIASFQLPCTPMFGVWRDHEKSCIVCTSVMARRCPHPEDLCAEGQRIELMISEQIAVTSRHALSN